MSSNTCPKKDAEPYNLVIEIEYNVTMGGISITLADRGNITGYAEAL
ncbi:MAG: hypothetical protein WAX07_01715 [Candidatus Altiarchaeia archaeon]